LYEVTEIVETVKMKSLDFLYWCLMLLFFLSVCSECVISVSVVYCVVHTEPVLSRVLRVVLRWLLVVQTAHLAPVVLTGV